MIGVIGDQGHLCGRDFVNELNEFRGWISFDVEFDGDVFCKAVYVVGADMSSVGSWVYGDAHGAEFDGLVCKVKYVGDFSFPAISDECDFVEVYAEVGHVLWVFNG